MVSYVVFCPGDRTSNTVQVIFYFILFFSPHINTTAIFSLLKDETYLYKMPVMQLLKKKNGKAKF